MFPAFLALLVWQQSPKVTPQSVCERYISAIGGQSALDAVRSVHLHREISYEGSHTYRVIADIVEDDQGRFLVDSTDSVTELREGFDGEHRWGHRLYNGQSHRFNLQDDPSLIADDRSGYRHNLIQRLRASQLLGADMVEGKKAAVLKWTSAANISTLYFFDVGSGLLVKTVHPVEFVRYGAMGDQMRTSNDGHFGFVDTCLYSDYRTLPGSGLLFAYKIDCTANGSKRTSTLKSAEVNQPIDERIFREPR